MMPDSICLADTKVLIQALSNQYSADNPTGCVPLLLSENNISFDILRPTIVGFKDFSPQMANYVCFDRSVIADPNPLNVSIML